LAFVLFFRWANAFDSSKIITNAWFSMKNYGECGMMFKTCSVLPTFEWVLMCCFCTNKVHQIGKTIV